MREVTGTLFVCEVCDSAHAHLDGAMACEADHRESAKRRDEFRAGVAIVRATAIIMATSHGFPEAAAAFIAYCNDPALEAIAGYVLDSAEDQVGFEINCSSSWEAVKDSIVGKWREMRRLGEPPAKGSNDEQQD